MPELLSTIITEGTWTELETYAFENEDAIAIDWRESEDSIVEDVAERLDEPLTYAWLDDDGGDYELTFRGKRLRAGLTMTTVDRCVMLTALNEILANAYEVRAFAPSIGTSDNLMCCLRSSQWWSAMDHQYPEQMARGFCKFRIGVDLFALSSAAQADNVPARGWQEAIAESRAS